MSNGEVDLVALERSAGQVSMQTFTAWMGARLAGKDPYLLIGDMTAPHGLFVSIARTAGRDSLLRRRIDESLRVLLEDAMKFPPFWLDELLTLVRVLRPHSCWALLEDAVRNRARFTNADRDAGRDSEWLTTAAAYSPNALLLEWHNILERHHEPKWVPIAYRALAQDPVLGLRYLPQLYRALRPDEQSVLIAESVQDAFEKLRPSARFIEQVQSNESRYAEQPGLQELLATIFVKLQLPIVLRRDVCGPVSNPRPPTTPSRRPASYEGIAGRRAVGT